MSVQHAQNGRTGAGKRKSIAAAGMIAVFIVSWIYLIHVSDGLGETVMGHHVLSPDARAWSTREFTTSFFMWVIMMAAMMLPSVAPYVMALSRMSTREGSYSGWPDMEASFLAGYLLVWAGYSLTAAAAQWWLHQNALLSPALSGTSSILAGSLLVVAGVFQWTPFRDACLDHCRSPIGFFLTSWKSGLRGALRMGMHHGLYCVGCCWALMALSFIAGVMNLLWMAVLTMYLLLDLVVVKNRWFSRATGAALLLWGLWTFVS